MGALQPEGLGGEAAAALRSRLAGGGDDAAATDGATVSVDQEAFMSLMVDKAVHDFARGENALLTAFETAAPVRDVILARDGRWLAVVADKVYLHRLPAPEQPEAHQIERISEDQAVEWSLPASSRRAEA